MIPVKWKLLTSYNGKILTSKTKLLCFDDDYNFVYEVDQK